VGVVVYSNQDVNQKDIVTSLFGFC